VIHKNLRAQCLGSSRDVGFSKGKFEHCLEFSRRFANQPSDYLVRQQHQASGAFGDVNIVKFICLGYMDEKQWEAMTEGEASAFMDDCFSYDDVLRDNGHFVGGEALQSARKAKTLRWRNGKVSSTDGPFIETKEQLGGILVLEAPDLNRAIELMSQHPSVRMGGCWEIRPAADLAAMMAESERRRAAKGKMG
jgi:hypothetical protein